MKIYVLADDRTGNTNQAIALAEKLTEEYTIIRLQYNCLAKLPNFLLKYYPIHIKSELLQDIMAKPLPDMIITAGRRTAVLAFYLKKKFESIQLIQIMQPSLPYYAFDAVILPYHDQRHCKALNVIPAKAGIQKKVLELLDSRLCGNDTEYKNIIPINGAINNVTEKFAAASLELQKHYPDLKHFIAAIIGGNNKKFNFNEDEAILFSSLLNKIYTNQQIPFFISFSRRTPQAVKSIIKNNMPSSTIIYDPNEDTGYTVDTSKVGSQISGEPAERIIIREHRRVPKFDVPNLEVSTVYNPYIAMLANAKYIISTADSISMCSEVASSGKPLYIFCPSNFNSSKHKIFIKQLVEQKIAKTFDESVTMLEEYSYKPLNEAERVAEIIKSLLKNICQK
ncbi:RPE5 domain protein [Rickettsia felis str. Pedreira]|uniref:RPE5 domain protein n=2 Tax=Rickettsia felis TaxID=42862 RepID=A0A0F3MTQ0_RICFI|nr:ELM1/GtrOC1 family putative glycosyltransferase [Rickettsia felis]AAY62021.1 unknown [Rickettsia felis URRWXCal2]KJV58827.1 RPE5 domain protein [Rickettsia felis str. Pedreira]MDE8611418.1 ELM1/GtrOC1 family putative glycosyltransferase [Rickettsia felis]